MYCLLKPTQEVLKIWTTIAQSTTTKIINITYSLTLTFQHFGKDNRDNREQHRINTKNKLLLL